MRAAIVELVGETGHHAGDGRAHQNGERSRQAQDDRPAHLARLDLLAQELGRASDHEAGDEHREDGEADHAVQAAAHAAEDDLAQGHLEHLDKTAQRGVGVVHGVNRAVGGGGGVSRPRGGGGDAEAALLALHVAAGLAAGHLDIDRAAIGQLRVPACSLTAMVPVKTTSRMNMAAKMALPCLVFLTPDAEGEAAGGRDQQQAGHLDDVGEGAGVLIRMGGVHAEEAAAVGAGLLDGDLGAAGPWGRNCSVTTRASSTTLPSTLTVSPSIWAPSTTLQPPSALGRTATELDELGLLSRLEVGDDAAGGQADAEHEVQRDEHVQDGAGEVDPEGTQTLLLDLAEAADQREHDRELERHRSNPGGQFFRTASAQSSRATHRWLAARLPEPCAPSCSAARNGSRVRRVGRFLSRVRWSSSRLQGFRPSRSDLTTRYEVSMSLRRR